MIQFLIYLPIASLMIIGLNKTTDEGMIFERLGRWVKATAGEFWSKPLISCPPCMASAHGSWFFLAVLPTTHWPLWYWPVFVLALSGLSYIVNLKLNG